ncbi:CBS domain-containing protein [Sulfurisphaera ohwakuensis]|uniref:CBS domain-containing protein n=1 Tax=Sulfurisphaera ohwakuensis TaxID=69656 RepID=UPI0036F3B51E
MLVKDIMTKDVIYVTKGTSIFKALEIMINNNIRRLLVEKDGIITIRDIVYNWRKIDGTVEEIMNKDIVFITPTSDIKEACRIMTSEGIGSLVVGDGVRIVGIVTERDLIRHCKVKGDVKVGDVMNVDPLVATKETKLSDIVDFMKSYWQRHAVIVDEKRPIGVISAKDIGRALLAKRDLTSVKAEGYMTLNVYKVTPDSSLETARLLMAEKNIGFLPVVDALSLLGSVGEREILAVLSI